MHWRLELLRDALDFRAGGYDGATETRKRPSAMWRGVSAVDEDSQIGKWDRSRLRLECLDLRRNNPIVAGVCERFADNVVGAGIVPQAKTSSATWNEQAESFFREWGKVCDYRKRNSLREIQRMVVQQRLLAGESFFALTDGRQIQPIEAERIVTPAGKEAESRIVDGIRLSDGGIPLEFFVAPRDKQGRADATKTEPVRREDIIHVAASMRFDQVRGIPELSPVITALRDFGMLTESTLDRAKMDARRGWAISGEQGAQKMRNLGDRNVTANAVAGGKIYEKIEDGTTYYLGKDEKIESLASNTPNSQYVSFNELILRIIGASLSIPYEFLILDFKQGSFSASKAAMAQTYKTFLNWWTWTCERFCHRLWVWRIAAAIKDRDLPPAPVDGRGVSEWWKVEWSQPDYTWIDPEGGVDAATKSFNLGVGSISSFARKQGRDGEDVLREKAGDIATAARLAQELNAAMPGHDFTWRDLISSLPPGTLTTQPQQPATEMKP